MDRRKHAHLDFELAAADIAVHRHPVQRELPGMLLVLGYFIALPPIMAITSLRSFYQRMGFIRYMVLANLLLFMTSLPIKMVLRWSFNLKYLIAIPEYFLNF